MIVSLKLIALSQLISCRTRENGLQPARPLWVRLQLSALAIPALNALNFYARAHRMTVICFVAQLVED